MLISFNSRNIEYKKPFGAIPAGESVEFTVAARYGVYINSLRVEMRKEGEDPVFYPMGYKGKNGGKCFFSVSIPITTAGIYWYRFICNSEFGEFTLGKGADGNIAGGSEYWFQQTVYEPHYVTPAKMKGGIIYHIFADRFNHSGERVLPENGVLKEWNEDVTILDEDGVFRANDFFGGNLQGIIDKLDYLKSLGVTMIYLSPIFKSSSNHRYDTGDYMTIDPLLGDEEKFKELIEKAKEYGMEIMLDGVFNHTGADSLYFNKYGRYPSVGAYQGLKSPYFDWYYFNRFPDEYGCWWGITVTPTVNKNNPGYREFILGKDGVLAKWSRLGLGGWRLDVVDELDKPFVDDIRRTVKSVDKNQVIIGEVWEDASTKVAYGTMRPYLLGNQLDGVMNYPFKNAIIDYCLNYDAHAFVSRVMEIYENYPKKALDCCMTLIGTHDTVRILNRLSGAGSMRSKAERLHYRLSDKERALGIKRLLIASSIQYFLPGVPSIYYGDEVGLEGFEDPINRRPMPWDNINETLLGHYRSLGRLRTEHRDIFGGDMTLRISDNILVVSRTGGGKTVTLYVNGGGKSATVRAPGVNWADGKYAEEHNIPAKTVAIIQS